MPEPATLKQQLDAEIADMEAREAARPGRTEGGDWWQLSAAEEEVFQIRRDRFPRMVMTWHCYEAFKGVSVSPAWDDALIEQARREHPQWRGEGISQGEFSDFAKAFGGLSNREAHAIYAKHEFWAVREGIARYKDESA